METFVFQPQQLPGSMLILLIYWRVISNEGALFDGLLIDIFTLETTQARSSVARSSVFLKSPRHSLANMFRWKRSEASKGLEKGLEIGWITLKIWAKLTCVSYFRMILQVGSKCIKDIGRVMLPPAYYPAYTEYDQMNVIDDDWWIGIEKWQESPHCLWLAIKLSWGYNNSGWIKSQEPGECCQAWKKYVMLCLCLQAFLTWMNSMLLNWSWRFAQSQFQCLFDPIWGDEADPPLVCIQIVEIFNHQFPKFCQFYVLPQHLNIGIIFPKLSSDCSGSISSNLLGNMLERYGWFFNFLNLFDIVWQD